MKCCSTFFLLQKGSAAIMVLVLYATVARPVAFDNWSTNQVTTNSCRLNQIIYGNGRFVAGGGWLDFGCLMSSENGVHWTTRAISSISSGGTPSLVYGLAYGPGKGFVAVGWGGSASFSTNGIDWQHAITGIGRGETRVVVYGSGSFVACHALGSWSLFASTNGLNWTATGPSNAVADITMDGSLFVAIGDNNGSVYLSFDGITWTARNIPGGNRISYANGLYFVPFGDGTNLVGRRLTGFNFSLAPAATGIPGRLGKVLYAGGGVCRPC